MISARNEVCRHDRYATVMPHTADRGTGVSRLASTCHAVLMGRPLKVIIAAVLVIAGLAGTIVFLSGQGLDRSAQWVSIVGTVVSVAVGIAGLELAWRARPGSGSPRRSGARVERTGAAMARGPGSRANTGVVGQSRSDSAAVIGTGDATATQGGWANTGDDHT